MSDNVMTAWLRQWESLNKSVSDHERKIGELQQQINALREPRARPDDRIEPPASAERTDWPTAQELRNLLMSPAGWDEIGDEVRTRCEAVLAQRTAELRAEIERLKAPKPSPSGPITGREFYLSVQSVLPRPLEWSQTDQPFYNRCAATCNALLAERLAMGRKPTVEEFKELIRSATGNKDAALVAGPFADHMLLDAETQKIIDALAPLFAGEQFPEFTDEMANEAYHLTSQHISYCNAINAVARKHFGERPRVVVTGDMLESCLYYDVSGRVQATASAERLTRILNGEKP